MRNIPDKALSISVLISLGNSNGSGFMYQSENFIYLITAKHVLYEESGNLRKNDIVIACQMTDVNDDSITRIEIKLDLIKSVPHRKADIAVIQIGKIIESENHTTKVKYIKGVERLTRGSSKPAVTSRNQIGLIKDVLISNDIYVFGYPTSLGLQNINQFDKNKPLIRKGIIANTNFRTNTIILDCPVYGGNSGGPVLQVVDVNGEKEFKLVGVISQYIPYVQIWRNIRERIDHEEHLNSGYSVATSMDPVLELIDKIEV